jgi:hypothetical protein
VSDVFMDELKERRKVILPQRIACRYCVKVQKWEKNVNHFYIYQEFRAFLAIWKGYKKPGLPDPGFRVSTALRAISPATFSSPA